MIDVINAAVWILVVIVLEVEVRLQLRGDLSDQVMNATKVIKLIDALEDLDDVQAVYTNMDLSQEVLTQLEAQG